MSAPNSSLAPVVALDDPSGTIAIGQAIGTDGLLAFSVLLGLAAMVAVIGVVKARRRTRQIARVARTRSEKMHELLRTVRMAESIADLGVWQYNPRTGQQLWSDGMRALFGISEDEVLVEGDAETLLMANNIDLTSAVLQRLDTVDPYKVQFNINDLSNQPRTVSVQACNLTNRVGEVDRVVAVVQDVTEQVERERDLAQSRELALEEASQARALAETDPLTGLANRRRIMVTLDQQLVIARRYAQPLSIIVFDIDRFKAVNDGHGHLAGDQILKRVAQIALDQSRTSDLVGRVGGEEFVWILPSSSARGVAEIAERLRLCVAQSSGVAGVPPVTISAGFAELNREDSALSLFARADAALYVAKNAGRNRVRVAA